MSRRPPAAALFVVAVALAGCQGERPDPHREAVRAYLRANLNDPDFEEVQWMPARELPGYKSLLIKHYERDIEKKKTIWGEANPSIWEVAESDLKDAKLSKPPLVARFRYRAKNTFKAKVLRDSLFMLSAENRVLSEVDSESEDAGDKLLWEAFGE